MLLDPSCTLWFRIFLWVMYSLQTAWCKSHCTVFPGGWTLFLKALMDEFLFIQAFHVSKQKNKTKEILLQYL